MTVAREDCVGLGMRAWGLGEGDGWLGIEEEASLLWTAW